MACSRSLPWVMSFLTAIRRSTRQLTRVSWQWAPSTRSASDLGSRILWHHIDLVAPGSNILSTVPTLYFGNDRRPTSTRRTTQPGAAQHRAVAQRDRIRDAGGHAGRTKGTDSRRARPQAGAGTRATSAAPSPGGLTFGVTMALPGETEAGSAGKQPCPGIVRRAHRDDDHGRGNERLAPTLHPIGSKDPDALKIPARRAASTLTRSVRSPVLAEPAHGNPSRHGGGRPCNGPTWGSQCSRGQRAVGRNSEPIARYEKRGKDECLRRWLVEPEASPF